MPTYDFKCQVCGEKFTKLVKISEKDKVTCPVCDSKAEQMFTGFGLAKSSSSSGQGGFSSGGGCRGFG